MDAISELATRSSVDVTLSHVTLTKTGFNILMFPGLVGARNTERSYSKESGR